MPYRCSTECATTDDYYANAGQVKHYYHQTDPYQNCHVGGINPIRTGGRWGGGHLILHASLFKKNLPTYPKWKKISVSLKSVWYQNMIKRVRIFHEIWKFYILYSQILRESAPPPFLMVPRYAAWEGSAACPFFCPSVYLSVFDSLLASHYVQKSDRFFVETWEYLCAFASVWSISVCLNWFAPIYSMH